MNAKFNSSIQHRGDVSYVKLAGVIDEDNELGGLVEKIPIGTAVIDLGEIARINSCGVRDWVNWLSKLESNGTRSVLVECSPAIVAQINLVNNFTGSGMVKSFYVPYFCPECDEEKVLLVETADMGPPPHEPPTCRCDECDLVMDFDDMPDSYFAFLSNQKKVAEAEPLNGTAGGSSKGRAKSRSSQQNLSPIPATPSVPSLPASQRGALTPGTHPGSTRPKSASKPPSQPMLPRAPSAPQLGMPMRIPHSGFTTGGERVVAEPGRGNGLVFLLVGILVALICVLAYVVLTK
jgi:anti-anti-sigma regulatory factor